MASILVHLTRGPDDPSRAALAFLVARTAVEEGHTVSVFLAADAVQLVRDGTVDALEGLGTGRLRDHVDVLVAAGVPIYLSGQSSKARALAPERDTTIPVQLAPPTRLVQLLLEHDRTLTY
jgi:predicted peroxiredoxin